jgi:hypothetical protein
VIFVLSVLSCLPSLPDPPPASDGGLAPIEVRVEDHRGNPWPLDAIPRRPWFAIDRPVDSDEDAEPIMLLSGSADRDLADDLERPPAAADRLVLLEILRSDGVRARPIFPLPMGSFVFAIGGWAHGLDGAPILVELEVAAGIDAGAAVVATWPAEATAGVPVGLPMAAIAFDGAIVLEPEALSIGVASSVEIVSCAALGFDAAVCVALYPQAPLAPSSMQRIAFDDRITDTTGAPIGPFGVPFSTGEPVEWTPPAVAPATCALDEEATEHACVFSDDGAISIALRAAGPMRFFLHTGARTAAAVAPRGEARLGLDGFGPDENVSLLLRAVDLAGVEQRFDLAIATKPPLATVSIAEVRSDPRGPEPAQEYVELFNYGPSAIDLGGFAISDRADREGDVIAEGVVLSAGGRVLVVPSGFEPESEADPPVPPGALLARVDGSIGSAGLSNAGEPLYLRDPDGRRVSAAPPFASEPGACLVRRAEHPRTGVAGAFELRSPCTPGTP